MANSDYVLSYITFGSSLECFKIVNKKKFRNGMNILILVLIQLFLLFFIEYWNLVDPSIIQDLKFVPSF